MKRINFAVDILFLLFSITTHGLYLEFPFPRCLTVPAAAAAASSSQHETHDMLHDHSHCQETAVTSNNADFDEMWRHNVMDTDIRLNKCQNAVVLGPHVYLVYE